MTTEPPVPGRHVRETPGLSETDEVVIWSGEHGAYWGPDGGGYSYCKCKAGRYSLADARRRTRGLGPEKLVELRPAPPAVPSWRPFDTAPEDGSEILVYREDAGVFVAQWTTVEAIEGERETEALVERGDLSEADAYEQGWFGTSVECGWFRIDVASELERPTHWMPMPDGPTPAPEAPDA